MRWNLVTTSYAGFRPEHGVPFQTSIGQPRHFTYPRHELKVLMPFVTFKKAPYDTDMARAAVRYKQYLDEKRASVEHALDGYAQAYPDQTLALLCYEGRKEAMDGGCHRRWFADWVQDRYGFFVPEVGMPAPQPVREPELTLW